MNRILVIVALLVLIAGIGLVWLSQSSAPIGGETMNPTGAAPAPGVDGASTPPMGSASPSPAADPANSFIVCPGDPRCPEPES